MIVYLPEDFAMQSTSVEPVRGVPIAGGSVALLATCGRGGLVRVAGLKPGRHYLLAGAAHRFARADAAGVAIIAVPPDAPALVTLVPVI